MILAVMAVLPLAAVAQDNINKVWQQVAGGSVGTQTGVNLKHGTDKDGKQWSYEFYSFKLKPNSSDFRSIMSAFRSDRKDAYDVYMKNANTGGGVLDNTLSITFGDNGEKNVVFGKDDTHNYEVLLFHDPKDADRRTAYAFVWFDTKDGSAVTCYMTRVYGADPLRLQSARNQSVTMQADGTIIKFDGTTNNSVVIRPSKTPEIKSDTKLDADQFMSMFTGLRSDLVRILDIAGSDQSLYLKNISSTASTMSSICKRFGKSLGTEERRACTTMLNDLKSKVDDIGVKTMLDMAIGYLK